MRPRAALRHSRYGQMSRRLRHCLPAAFIALALACAGPASLAAQQADGTAAPAQTDQSPSSAPAPSSPAPADAIDGPQPYPPNAHTTTQPRPTAESSASPAANGDTATTVAAAIADSWEIAIQNMSLSLTREGIDDGELTQIRARAEEIIDKAHTVENELSPEVSELKTLLAQLGPAPAEGEPAEAADIAERRDRLSTALANTDAALKKARLTVFEAEQIIRDIAELRRDRFTQSLLVRNRSVFDPDFWLDAAEARSRLQRSFGFLISDSWSYAVDAMNAASALILLGAFAAAVVLGIFVRSYIRRFAAASDNDREDDPRLRKLLRAWLVIITDGFIPLAIVGIFYLAFQAGGLLSPRFAQLSRGFVLSIAVFSFLFGMARAICAPLRPHWRVIPLSDANASQSMATFAIIGGAIAIGTFLETVFDLLYSPISIYVAKHAIVAFIIAVFGATGLWRFGADIRSRPQTEDVQPLLFYSWMRRVVWLSIFVILGALATGFIALANFIAIQIVFIVTVATIVWLVLALLEEVVNILLAPDNRISGPISVGLGISENGVKQITLVASGLARLSVIVIGIVLVLLPWGLDTGQWRIWLQKAFFGFRFGDVNISIASILVAIVLFVVGIIATRAIQNWLGNRFLPSTKLDVGLRNSIRTVIGYVGITIAAIFAVTYIGFNLQNVAIVAGALSVGIGFGLQSIVNNFVSGLILLAERPIKEGDWVVAGTEQGYVRKISIRATEIETFDRATVIVPNSDLITGTVKNWMHSNMMGRVIVSIGVSYDTDPEELREILLEIARAHPSVLAYPEPRVFFTDFGNSALVFDLYAYIADVNSSLTVRSDFRFEIFKRLREANIEIPFPQRDINLRDIDRLEAAFAGAPQSRVSRPEAPKET